MTSLNFVGRSASLAAVAVLVAGCSAPALADAAAPLAAVPTTTTSASLTSTTSPATTPPEVTLTEVATTVTEVVAIPFGQRSVDDTALDQGRTVVRTAGRAGSKTVTWLVRTRGGVELSRAVSSERVTAAPVDQVTAVGTRTVAPPPAPKASPTPAPKPAPTPAATKPAGTGKCDPNYSRACVPIASDVDCAGGSGNGPAYVQGPVQVVGTDIYKLDADHDGVGCED
jgi:hypothetical protein